MVISNIGRLTIFSLVCVAAAHADPPAQPVPRVGSCPGGYNSSGAYCVPTKSGRFAVQRSGSCPGGYYSSGNYCVASSDSSKLAIQKLGSCPSGY